MKLFKKILWLGAIVASVVTLGLATVACDDSTTPSGGNNDDSAAYVYRVSLQNETGFGFEGATVKLMNGNKVVASKTTNQSGNANFFKEEITPGNYTIVVEGAPEGYALPDRTYETTTTTNTKTVIPIKPTGLLEEDPTPGTVYKVGDVIHDFTIKLSNSTTYTFSEVLEEKQLIMLNFWATWCGPCKSEFPAMHNAAIAYEETVSVLAISTTDTLQNAGSFMESNSYEKFHVGAVSGDSKAASLHSMLRVSSIPQTVMIDRYGVIVYSEVGSMPSASAFAVQFDKFIGEDYIPTVVPPKTDNTNDSEDDGKEQLKPTFTAPSTSDLKATFASTSASGFTFRYQEEGVVEGDEEYDEYNWPWLISEDKEYIYASNANIHSSYAILYSDITVKAGDVVVFDYKVGSEEDCDIFYVIMDGEVINKYSGYHSDTWNTSYAYVFRDYEAGKHSISFVFLKDADTTYNDDVVYLKNLRIDNVANLDNPAIDANIFRHAATEPNTDENATTQFKNYVTVVYNEKDEYYHVGEKDGPVLYANMMNASPWNETSLWILAYNNYVAGDGLNYRYAIEDFAWEAAQPTSINGYTPVTEDLKYLLDAAARYVDFGAKFDGEYHENEWLELCVYWEHYGCETLPEDPMAGFTYTAAIEMQVGENEINTPFPLNPRGWKYKFTPTESGAYHVYSTGDSNTFVFLVDGDRKTMLGTWDDKLFVEVDKNGEPLDSNFEFYWYFEAGKTYYMLFTTYLDVAATYNVNVDFEGATYTYLENAARGPYSMNLSTSKLFLPDAIDYTYSDPAEGGDGYYHHVKKNGELGGKIYLDVNRVTVADFFKLGNASLTIYEVCQQALGLGIFKENGPIPVDKRALYIDGVDYTEQMMRYCRAAVADENDPYYGFVALDKDAFELLQTICLSAKYEGVEDTWQLMCYYEKTMGAE